MASNLASEISDMERLLVKFMDGACPPEQKREIEAALEAFKQREDAHFQARAVLSYSGAVSTILQFFCVSAFETVVRRRWLVISPQERADTRDFIWNFLLSKQAELERIVKQKIYKVLVDIAKRDWPQYWSSFFTTILQAVQTPSTTLLGLSIFRTLVEEISHECRDVSSTRSKELRTHLLSQVSSLLSVLSDVMSTLFNQCCSAKVFPVQSSEDVAIYTSHFDSEGEQVLDTIFEILSGLFTWVSLSDHLTPELLQILFRFSRIDNGELSIHAIGCLNEVITGSRVPREFENFVIEMFKEIYITLERFGTSPKLLSNSTPEYLSKFTQFISMFVSNHFHRIANNDLFPISQFLGLFYSYSLKQPDSECFEECLDIWCTFAGHILDQTERRVHDSEQILAKYGNGMIDLVDEILCRVLHEKNFTVLDKLDDLDRDPVTGMTERDGFIGKCIDAVSACSYLYPQLIAERIDTLLSVSLQKIQSIHQSSANQIEVILRDVGVSLKLAGRINDVFMSRLNSTFTLAIGMLRRIIDIAVFGLDNFYTLCKQAALFPKIQGETYSAMRAYIAWIGQYSACVDTSYSGDPNILVPDNPYVFTAVISAIVDSCIRIFENGIGDLPVVQYPALQMIESMVSTVKPDCFISLPRVIWLISEAEKLSVSVQSQPVLSKLLTTITLVLVTPFGNQTLRNMTEPNWESRCARSVHLWMYVCQEFCHMSNEHPSVLSASQQQLALRVTVLITAMINATGRLNKVSKGIVFESIRPSLSAALSLFTASLPNPAITAAIVDVFVELYKNLKNQASSGLVEQVIRTFLGVLSGDRLVKIAISTNEFEVAVVEKLLVLLTLLLKASDAVNDGFLPSVISMVLDQLGPLASEGVLSVHLLPQFYDLIHCILLENWRFFFPSKLSQAEEIRGESELRGLLVLIGSVFRSGGDIEIVRQNLDSLILLNERRGIFRKHFFLQSLHLSFLETFVDILVSRTLEILKDELITVIYSLASIDFDSFFNDFLVRYLESKVELDKEQKNVLLSNWSRDVDVPTFTLNLINFARDFYYHLGQT